MRPMFKRILGLSLSTALLMGGVPAVHWRAEAAETAEPAQPIEWEVGGGRLRVEAYADDVIRVRFAPDGTFRDKGIATFVDPQATWERVQYTVTEEATQYVLSTAKLTVRVDKSSGAVSYWDKSGVCVAAEGKRTAQKLTLDGKTMFQVRQNFVAADTEYLYGLGNVDSVVGNRGQTVSVVQTNTEKRTPMFYSNQGYGVLFDITSNGQLGWGEGNASYYYQGSATDSIDYYFFYGPEADEVIAGYRQVTGAATMLPKNAFGYVQSRNRYTSQKELLEDMQRFRERGVPVDVTVIDYYWWKNEFNDITRWNTANWPDVSSMMQQLHEMHITASISVWPSFRSGSETYALVSQKEGFLLPEDSYFGRVYDPTTAENRAYYWNLINENIFSKGMDSIWLDACEPEMGSWTKTGIQTAAGNSRVIGTLYPLLTNQGVYEGQRAVEGNTKRVNTLSRGMVAGSQRYGTQSWSGDVASTWEQLPKEVRGSLNFAASGLPYFSTDTGGYFSMDTGDAKSRELFLRWLQFSTFSSIMRVHGQGCIKNPWSFGAEYEEYILSCINLRERLIPYIYSLAGGVTQEGGTIVRPLVFDYRTDPHVWQIDDQYMFGDYFMVCPVTTLGQRTRSVYLPAGTWIDFWTGDTIQSTGETYTVAAPLDEMPLFVKAGAVLPLAMESQYVDEHPDEGEIRVYMGADGSFTLYEDDGNTYAYESGAFSTIPLQYDEATRTLTIGKRTGSYEGMPQERQFHIVFVQGEYGSGVASSAKYDRTVTYTGEEVSVTFRGDFEPPVPPLKLSTLPKPTAAPAAETPASAMIGEWLFSEGEGAKVSDTSGTFSNGAVKNTATAEWTAGKADNALRFSGGSATVDGTYVDVADSDTLDVANGVSFSAWVNFTGSGHGNIVNKGGNGSENPGFSFIILNGNRLQVELQTADGAKTSAQATQSNFTRNVWHHVAFTWQSTASGGDGVVRIYMDGKQVSDDNNTANRFEGPIGTNELPLRFGRSADNEPEWPNYFRGIMDEVRLYNYRLDAADVAALAAMEAIGIANPENIVLTPADGALHITWSDPDCADLQAVRVQVKTEDQRYNKTFTVAAGVRQLTVDKLVNARYYQVSLQTVLTDGRTSQGAYLVGGVAPYPTAIQCVVTHDDSVYGYVTNYTGAEVSGTLVAEICDMANGGLVRRTVSESVHVGALDAQRFQVEVGAFEEGQAVRLTFVQDGTLAAQPVGALRERRYVSGERPEAAREALQALCDATAAEGFFTAESMAQFASLRSEAAALLATGDASAADVLALRMRLAQAPVLTPDDKAAARAELWAVCAVTPDEAQYTAESYAAYTALRQKAEALLAQGEATAAELSAMADQLAHVLVEKPDFLRGDANGDGKVTTADAATTLQYAAELIDETRLNAAAADVNGDGKVTTADAALILQKCADVIEEFPAP